MSTTAYFTSNNARLQCVGTPYSSVRAGSASLSTEASVNWVGQRHFDASNIYCYQSPVEFDTAFLGAGATVVSAILHTTINSHGGASNGKVLDARACDFGASVATADFVAGGSLSALPLCATYTSDGSTTGAVTWTDVAMAANINKTGYTRLLLVAADQVNNVAPASGGGDSAEYVDFKSYSGLSTGTYLVITYTTGAGVVPFIRTIMAGGMHELSGGIAA